MDSLKRDGIGMTSRRTRDRLVQRLMDKGIQSGVVLDAIRTVPRHLFLEEALAHRAYEDTALPIGYNQTLSQPYIVARMTEVLLAEGPLSTVLEVGTGSGYQTAVLAGLVKQVFSTERILSLQEKARQRLSQLSLHNIQLRHSDGGMGWPLTRVFDGIIVTAAPGALPQALLDQLSPEGGRLIAPVGQSHNQYLELVVRHDNKYRRQRLEPVSFVPLLSGVVR